MLTRLTHKIMDANLTLVLLAMLLAQSLQDGQDSYLQFLISVLLYALLSLSLFLL